MFACVSKYLARCRRRVDYQAVKNPQISSLSTAQDDFFPCFNMQSTKIGITSSRQQYLHTKTKNKKHLLRPVIGSSSFGREHQCYYSGKDVAHFDGVQSAELEIDLLADTKKVNKQMLKEKESERCKQTNKSPFYDDNIYISDSWTCIEPESVLEFESKSENKGQPYIFSKDLSQFHSAEDVSSLHISNPNVSMEATNQILLNHMPDFEQVAEIYYNITRKNIFVKKLASLYSNICSKGAPLAAQKLMRHSNSLMYCCPAEVFSCMQILKKFGVPLQQQVKNIDLLVLPSGVLKAHGQLVQDLGLCSSSPIVCLSRLEDLMKVSEAELIEHNFLPHDSSLLERLLSKLGSDHVLEEQQLRQTHSQTYTMQETYNKILTGLLAQRFAVSTSSVKSLLRRYQPTYKPLSHYYLIADIIDKHLRLDFEQVSQQPALLDLSPHDTLALLQQRSLVAGRPTFEALRACPDLGRVPHALLQRWLELLDTHSVLQFPLDGVVPWVLKQDLLVMAKLVLNFLVHHPEWQNIKSSHFLFEIFANPGVMNDLMKKVPATCREGGSSITTSDAHNPLSKEVARATNAPSPAAAELEAWEEDFESSAVVPHRWDYCIQDGDDEGAAYGEEAAGGESYGETNDDTDDWDDSSDNSVQGPATAPASAGVPAKTRLDGICASLSSVDRYFQTLPADVLDVSDKYITFYKPGNNDLTSCTRKNQPSAEVKSYLQAQLKIEAHEINRVGRHGAAPCSLPDAVTRLQLLLQHGYSKQQIAAAVEIFGYDQELISRELCRMTHRFTNYEEYWRRHPNVVNLLLYYVTKVTKNAVCDENLE